MIRQNVCVLAIFTAITLCTSSARAATQFDGPWKMRFITLTGPCNPFYNVKGQIIDGSIQYGGVSGRVGRRIDRSMQGESGKAAIRYRISIDHIHRNDNGHSVAILPRQLASAA